MRKSPLTIYVALGLAIVVLASCAPVVGAGENQNGAKGTFSYALSPFNPVVSRAYAKAHQNEIRETASTSKAFMASAKVKFEVHQYTGTVAGGTAGTMGTDVLVDSWIEYPSTMNQDSGSHAVIGTHSLAAGDYTLQAKVYADINAADTDYTVYGSKYFTVTAGQSASTNQQTVVCYPAMPNWISQGSSASGSTLTKPWTFDANGDPTALGSEAWYYFYPWTADPTKITVTPDTGSKAILWVFVFDGTTGALAKIDGADAFQVSATAGAPVVLSGIATQSWYSYYVCVIDVGSASDTNRSYSVKYAADVAAPTITAQLTPLGSAAPSVRPATWTSGTIDNYATAKWYSMKTTPGKIYYLWMNSYNYGYEASGSYYYGDGTSTAEIITSAYQKDFSTPYFTYGYAYSGYNYGYSFTATEDEVYFKIESNYSTAGALGNGTGSFGINATTDQATVLSFGSNTSSGSLAYLGGNQFQGSKFTVTSGGTLQKFGFIPLSDYKTVSYYDYATGTYLTDSLKVTFALYKANGTDYGYDSSWNWVTYSDGPGDLVGYTDMTTVTTADGTTAMEIPLASASSSTLAAGDYWIVANTNGYTNVSGTSTYNALQTFASNSFGSVPPTTLSGIAYIYPQYQTFDFYIKVQQ